MSPNRRFQGSAAVVAALVVGALGACARQGAPPGGPVDQRPPVVVQTEPDTFAQVDGEFRGPIRFHFDERISERSAGGSLDDLVVISPATGEIRVGHSRRSLTVEMDGGFRPGTVYRVTLQPGVQDLFNNPLRDPFELVFSTGGEYTPTAVAGLVWDRITGDGLEDVEVRAVSTEEGDTVTHVSRTDADGVYAFRYLPTGRYQVVAFQDRNRDGIVDPMETQGRRGLLLNSPTDSVLTLSVGVLMPDTTPARLISVELLDSLTLLVEFDDYLDPDRPLTNVGASLVQDTAAGQEGVEPVPPPAVGVIYHEHEYRAYQEAVADSFARLDSLDALAREMEAQAAAAAAPEAVEDTLDTVLDTLAAVDDTLPAVEDTAAAAPEELPRRVPPTALPGQARRDETPRPDGSEAPSRTVVILLGDTLAYAQAYQLTVTGVINIGGVPQGGGDAAVVRPSPPEPEPDTLALDSLALDSLALPDTGAVMDSLLAPPDTGGVVLDIRKLLRRRPAP